MSEGNAARKRPDDPPVDPLDWDRIDAIIDEELRVAWFFPVGTVLDILAAVLAFWVLWQVTVIALRPAYGLVTLTVTDALATTAPVLTSRSRTSTRARPLNPPGIAIRATKVPGPASGPWTVIAPWVSTIPVSAAVTR